MERSRDAETIQDELTLALAGAVASLPGVEERPTIAPLSRPADHAHGDYSSNAAFPLAKSLRKKPAEIAAMICERFRGPADATPAGAGFVNLRVSRERLLEFLRDSPATSWRIDSEGRGRHVNIEFVSANPTGPLHVGHGRGAVIGDAAARLLSLCGYDVTREYYVNDVGRQIDDLGSSILAHARRRKGLDDGGHRIAYAGAYVEEVAGAYLEKNPALDDAEPGPAADFGKTLLLDRIMRQLDRLGIRFDRIVHESSLTGRLPALCADYREKGLLYDAERAEGSDDAVRRADSKASQHRGEMAGGTFLRTSRFGDETDRILVKADGKTAYFTADIAYHLDKLDRGYDRVIDVWGADHGGHVTRMRAALAALDKPVERFEVILCQLVRLIRGGVEVKMSKRSGDMVTLEELIDEVGPDAVRFFFLMRTPSAQCDFDLDLAVKQSADNPVFYCQYAHARSCQLLAKGAEHGLVPDAARLDLLTHETEEDLMRRLALLPAIVRQAGEKLELHRLPEAAMDLAKTFHRYQTAGKEDGTLRIVRPDERELSAARLWLVRASGAAMKWMLDIMGVSAPEKM